MLEGQFSQDNLCLRIRSQTCRWHFVQHYSGPYKCSTGEHRCSQQRQTARGRPPVILGIPTSQENLVSVLIPDIHSGLTCLYNAFWHQLVRHLNNLRGRPTYNRERVIKYAASWSESSCPSAIAQHSCDLASHVCSPSLSVERVAELLLGEEAAIALYQQTYQISPEQ